MYVRLDNEITQIKKQYLEKICGYEGWNDDIKLFVQTINHTKN